ncbi:hypothetical protein MMC18_004887 [Xylographa bjoerkii]|nr:hypothetical protein [Xylographa bjoerkii]
MPKRSIAQIEQAQVGLQAFFKPMSNKEWRKQMNDVLAPGPEIWYPAGISRRRKRIRQPQSSDVTDTPPSLSSLEAFNVSPTASILQREQITLQPQPTIALSTTPTANCQSTAMPKTTLLSTQRIKSSLPLSELEAVPSPSAFIEDP